MPNDDVPGPPEPPLHNWPPPPPPAPKPRGPLRGMLSGCLVAVLAVCGFLMLAVVALVLIAVGVAVGGGARVAAEVHGGVSVQEVPVSGRPDAPKLAIIPVQGVLMAGGGVTGRRDPAEVFKAMLERARGDAQVAAVLLEVDSPGGGITTCDIMHKYLLDYRRDGGGPVVVLMKDVAASGGYYISCAAQHIMAHPTTVTGSIGVIMPLFDASGLLRLVGVSDRSIKSGRFKDLGSPFSQRTAEERAAEDAILQAIVMDMYERFVQVVAEGRKMDIEKARRLSDGRVYTSRQALENGLIDSIGYRQDAIEVARQLAKVEEFRVVRYAQMPGLKELLFLRARGGGMKSGFDALSALAASPRLMYLWCPQAAVASQ